LQQNFELKHYNTFGVAAKAQVFARFDAVSQLRKLWAVAGDLPRMVLGGGSNVLFTQDYPGWVLLNEIKGRALVRQQGSEVLLKVGAGENWHQTVMWTLGQGWGGLENLSLIPGSCGAAPIQNIGAYGVELKEVLAGVKVWDSLKDKVEIFDNAACELGYRSSIFKQKEKGRYVILYLYLKVTSQDHRLQLEYGAIKEALEKMGIGQPSPADISKAVIQIRQSKLPDPSVLGNAGSFFKNPLISNAHLIQLLGQYPDLPHYPQDAQRTKVAAGWLIEKAGWKGKRVGNTGSHAQQALVLVNYGEAAGREIRDYAKAVMLSVEQKFAIKLEPEVNIL
jgi:UDP-N-acetylmuramate dehydrogenase